MNELARMDAYLAIVSNRAVRRYRSEPLREGEITHILQAGRATGSARNRQPWRFYVVRSREVIDRLANTVASPDNVHGAPLAIALVLTAPRTFDAGRAAQNMMLAAWSLGIGSCPNTPRDRETAASILDLDDELEIASILSLGYPDERLRPSSNDPEDVLTRIDRKPLDELTHWID